MPGQPGENLFDFCFVTIHQRNLSVGAELSCKRAAFCPFCWPWRSCRVALPKTMFTSFKITKTLWLDLYKRFADYCSTWIFWNIITNFIKWGNWKSRFCKVWKVLKVEVCKWRWTSFSGHKPGRLAKRRWRRRRTSRSFFWRWGNNWGALDGQEVVAIIFIHCSLVGNGWHWQQWCQSQKDIWVRDILIRRVLKWLWCRRRSF